MCKLLQDKVAMLTHTSEVFGLYKVHEFFLKTPKTSLFLTGH